MKCSTHIAYQKLQYSHSEIWMLFLANPKLLKDFLIDRWGGITVFSQGPSFFVWHDLGLMEDWPPWCLPPPPLGTGQGQIDRTAWGQAPLCQQPPHALPDVFNKGFHLTNSAAAHRPASFNPPRLWNKHTLKPDRKDVGNRCTDAGNDAACTAVLKDKMSNIFQSEPKKLDSC